MNKPHTIEEYILFAPMDQQAELQEIRRLIERNFTRGKPGIGPEGHPVYTIGKTWKVGFAYKAQGPVIYIADTTLLNQHEDRLKHLKQSKTCIRYANARDINITELNRIVAEILQKLSA